MSEPATPRPVRCADLVIKPIGDDGRSVVKNPRTGEFFEIREEERFLLEQLDGRRDADAICTAFEERFGEPLSSDEFAGFLEMAAKQGLVEIADCAAVEFEKGPIADSCSHDSSSNPQSAIRPLKNSTAGQSRQSLLYWRKSLFDPDRLFNRLEPQLRCLWTRGFLVFSAACIVLACGLLWLNRNELATSFHAALRWETLAITWLVMLVVIALHEFAHGLTCKHYGGEVREIGFLLMFFMPCFYCNVSDAWLFREKSKRLWVTFAGGYFELFVWALAVFAWRLTALDSAVNYVAFLVIVSAGIQSFFNFNPLLKLDGYYLLSDWMEIPNLRQRALNRAKAHFRRFGWGGPKPQADRRGRFLTTFGFVCWSFSGVFLAAMLLGLAKWFGSYVGSVGGYLAAGGLAIPAMLGVFGGTSSGEFTKMITKRRMRTFCWLLMLCGLFAGLRLIEVDEYSSGSFTLRPARRMEFRAPVAGFLKEVRVNEGDHVSPGDVIARLEIPELDSRIGRQRAELAAAEAELELLREGTRPETIADQKQRIARAGVWRAAADADLLRQKAALGAELNALQAKVAAARVVRAAAGSALSRMKIAVAKQAATPEQLDEVREKLNVAEARVKQAQSEWLARKAQGLLLAKRERDRRAKELADEQAALTLLEAGSRPQEIVAGKARVARVKSELNHLRQLQGTLEIRADVAGVVVTPRLREKIGAHLREGDAICTIEDRSSFEAEIALTEQKIAGIQPGQRVELKARALPFETLTGRVTGVAQSAVPQERSQSAVVVYSRIESPHEATRTLRASGSLTSLRSELTGHARIYTARKPIGEILLDRTFRLLRTEFWW